MPITNDDGEIIGMYVGFCEIEWPTTCSESEYISGIPYGNQTEENSLQYEDGYKAIRGYLTEGRYLVFESNGYAITNSNGSANSLQATTATSQHESIYQRWVSHAQSLEGTTFIISSAADGRYIAKGNSLTSKESDAETFNITYIGGGDYTIQKENGHYLSISSGGSLDTSSNPASFNIWSVTYHK